MSQNEIVSETNYYPFGLAHKGYNEHVNSTNLGEQFKFNGKELNDEMDLGWYDFGARPYMPDINRTPTIDPHANRYSSLSPYSMFANNPLIYVDPDGKDIVLAAGLTSEQKLQIVGNLQRLTNDKLVYSTQKDGTAIIKIVSLGSQNSNKDLNFGTNLIRVLNKKGADVKTTVIDITSGGNKTLFSGANGKLKSDGTSNVGSDAIVEFNPSKTTGELI